MNNEKPNLHLVAPQEDANQLQSPVMAQAVIDTIPDHLAPTHTGKLQAAPELITGAPNSLKSGEAEATSVQPAKTPDIIDSFPWSTPPKAEKAPSQAPIIDRMPGARIVEPGVDNRREPIVIDPKNITDPSKILGANYMRVGNFVMPTSENAPTIPAQGIGEAASKASGVELDLESVPGYGATPSPAEINGTLDANVAARPEVPTQQ